MQSCLSNTFLAVIVIPKYEPNQFSYGIAEKKSTLFH